ncbi:MAG: class II glutamine amidotransferase [Candidatus Heimdallarchaeota archaeon]|nr:class II glutamine amidotransferase [Candidatus Heimdallarchaeota archaeon]
MCRMVSIYSNTGITKELLINVFADLQLMSMDETIHHELHDLGLEQFSKGNCKHGHGFGIAFYKGGIHYKHSETAIYEEDVTDDLLDELCGSTIVLIHARLASPGLAINRSMVHPFVGESNKHEVTLVHNGTVKDQDAIPYNRSKYRTNGIQSDSQKLLFAILSKLDEGESDMKSILSSLYNSLPETNGNNLFIIFDNALWITSMFEKYPIYFTMQYIKLDHAVVVASESMPRLGNNWKPIENGTIAQITMEFN